jgi:hypothetical protein
MEPTPKIVVHEYSRYILYSGIQWLHCHEALDVQNDSEYLENHILQCFKPMFKLDPSNDNTTTVLHFVFLSF